MITITHTHEAGTLIEGSRKGDGVYEILRGLRGNWRYFPSIRQIGLGQSRDKPAKTWHIEQAAEALRKAGHDVTVEIDDTQRRSFAEAEAERYERAEGRADYHDEHAGKAAARSDAAYGAEHGILGMIPAGQPVLVGHHSERRHRRDLERADNLRRRGRAESERSDYHADRAAAAERFKARRESIPTTLRRIAKLEADERRIQRDLDGRVDYASDGNGGYKLRLIKPEGDYLARLEVRAADVADELAYWREHVKQAEASGAKVWGPGDFAKGDYALSGWGLCEVLRVSPKTLTIPDTLSLDIGRVVSREAAQAVSDRRGFSRMYTRTVPYDEIKARKTAAEVAELIAKADAQEVTA